MKAGRGLRLLRQLAGLVSLAAALVYTIALVLVLIVSQQDQRREVDAIVVLGAAQYNGRPSPVLRARLDHALALYRDGMAPLIVVTGGVGRGDTTSEAIVGRRYLVTNRVPARAVAAQPEGRSTMASMNAVARWLRGRGLTRVLLVSDPFHMCRLRLEARRTSLEAYTSPTESSPISDNPVLELRYLFAEGLKVPVAWARGVVAEVMGGVGSPRTRGGTGSDKRHRRPRGAASRLAGRPQRKRGGHNANSPGPCVRHDHHSVGHDGVRQLQRSGRLGGSPDGAGQQLRQHIGTAPTGLPPEMTPVSS